jgi:hypothetical protein
MHIVDRIISELGGPTAIANETGIPLQTVHSWKPKGNIPHWRRQAVIDAAIRMGKTLSPDAAAYLTSSERAPSKSQAA